MAFVVAVAQRKGGAGKSTLAANLAVCLAEEGHRVALLDTDPQQTLLRWNTVRRHSHASVRALDFQASAGWRIPAALRAARDTHDFVVLDTPPHDDTDARIAIRAADLVLMPLQPSAPDLWAADATIRIAVAEATPLVAVLNRMPPQTRTLTEMVAELKARRIDVLGPSLGNRVNFVTAFAQGLAVTEAFPRSVAAYEMRALTQAFHLRA